MGYTHYVTIKKPIFDADRWAALVADTKTILAHLPTGPIEAEVYDRRKSKYIEGRYPLIICGGDGTGDPVVSLAEIALNGQDSGPKGLDLSHESFGLDPAFLAMTDHNDGFIFCKTARKPYDIVVTAILIRFAYHFAESDGLKISSDGDVDEWEPGRKLCQELFGVGVVPFKDRQPSEV